MIATLIIFFITIIGIILSLFLFPKLKIGKINLKTYWIIAFLGAVILICFSLAPINLVVSEFVGVSKMNPLKILVLFFSMTLISVLLDEFGLFKFLASVAAKRANNKKALFFSFYFLVATLTIFTSNDVVILTFTPFI